VSFAEMERGAWTTASVAAAYAEEFTAAVGFTVGPLLEAAGVRRDTGLLDLACGPGTVSRAALARGARVTGADFSREMLRRARRSNPGLRDCLLGRSERLPLRDARFEALTCNFGLLHFADPDSAIAEAARVLAPGGRLAFTIWSPDSDLQRIVPESIEALGLRPELPRAPDFFAFAQPGALSQRFARAGLEGSTEQKVRGVAQFANADRFWRMFLEGTARTRASLLAVGEEARPRVEREVRGRLDAYARDGGFAVPVSAVLGSARRPPA
jgi:SAM-dependent methyltransferase